MFARFILLFLLAWTFSVLVAAASAPWIALEGCTLVNSAYNDGDSFHVKQGDKEYIFRLYFVDTPEEDDGFPQRVDEQGQYFGIDHGQVTATGLAARDLTREMLAQPFTVYTRWHSAQGRSRTPRFYAFVRSSGKDLAEELVSRGLARVYGVRATTPEGESAGSYRTRLLKLEDDARLARLGAWEYAKPIATKKRDANADLRVVVAPRTVAVYSEELPRRRQGEITRETRVRILEEYPDGWVHVEYDTPAGEAIEAFCLRWDLSLPDYTPPGGGSRAHLVP